MTLSRCPSLVPGPPLPSLKISDSLFIILLGCLKGLRLLLPSPLQKCQLSGFFYMAYSALPFSSPQEAIKQSLSLLCAFDLAPCTIFHFKFTPSREGSVFSEPAPFNSNSGCTRNCTSELSSSSELLSALFFSWHPSGHFQITSHSSTLASFVLINPVHVHCSQLAILSIPADSFSSQHLSSTFFIVFPISCLASFGMIRGLNIRGSWGFVRLMLSFFPGAPGDFHVQQIPGP